MDKIIGAASEFYRLRVTRIDATEEPAFEWREDILYRSPSVESPEEREEWVVEAVTLDDEERVTALARFTDPDEAHEYLVSAGDDLDDLTKSQFESAYLSDT